MSRMRPSSNENLPQPTIILQWRPLAGSCGVRNGASSASTQLICALRGSAVVAKISGTWGVAPGMPQPNTKAFFSFRLVRLLRYTSRCLHMFFGN